MTERFLCDFLYHQDHRIDMTEVIALDLWEAYEWMEETFLELHLDPTRRIHWLKEVPRCVPSPLIDRSNTRRSPFRFDPVPGSLISRLAHAIAHHCSRLSSLPTPRSFC